MKVFKKLFTILLVFLTILSCKHKAEDNNSTHGNKIPDIKRPENVCRVNILNSVNGSYVRDLKLTITDCATNKNVFDEVCPYGVAFPKLDEGKHYDFAVKGNSTYSSSLVKNLKVKTVTDDIGIVCLLKAQKTRNDAFLNLKEFKFIDDDDNKTDVRDGMEITTPIEGRFTAKVSSSAGAIHNSLAYGFAAKLGLGKTPSSSWNPKQDIVGSPTEYPKFEGEEWISDFSFSLDPGGVWESFTKDSQDLIAVFYDVVGNRLETHNYVVCKPKIANFKKYTGSDYSLTDFYVGSNTYSAYNQMYSTASSYNDGTLEDAHYAPSIFFAVKDKYANMTAKIIAVEVFRREVINGKDTEFAHIFTSYFRNPSDIREDPRSSPLPYLLDRTGTCEVNKEYEYKIRIYTKDGFYFESGEAKCKVLPQFKAYLAKPEQHASLSMPSRFAPFDAVLQDFAISVSDASLWDAKKSDYFTCGLVIHTFQNIEMYSMLFRYHFNYKGTGKEEIEFLATYNQKTIRTTLTELKAKKLVPYYIEVKDFVEWDASNSLVILKKEMLTTRLFNITEKWNTFKDGEIYYWDVFGMGGNLPEDLRLLKKMPPCFTKEYDDGNGVVSYSNTYGAGLLLSSTSSENGRFDFTVKSQDKLSNASLPERPSMENIVEGSYVVKADESFETASLPSGVKIIGKIALENGLNWYCVSCDEKIDILIPLLKTQGVRCADYQHKITLPYERSEGESVLGQLSFGDNPVFKGSAYSLEITKALEAYEKIGFGSETVLAGIMDSGVSSTHEDLEDANGQSIIQDHFVQNWIDQGGGKFSWGGWISNKDKKDLQGHGTHCVGIMAAVADNGKGIIGVSGKNTKVVMYRGMLDEINKNKNLLEFCIMDAIRKFTDYVKEKRSKGELHQDCVPLNLSIGDGTPSVLGCEMINYALANGVLPVVAMGNDGLRKPSYPAAYKGVLAVGSSNGSDRVSAYSNKGHWISIVAPGENIVSLKHDDNEGYVTFNGTSMAAPFVAGAVAYLAGLNPEITPQQMKTILESTADKIEGNEDFNVKRGYGRINVYKAAKLIKEGGVKAKKTQYSSFALKAKIEPKAEGKNGEHDINFGNFVPYVFLYDDRDVCVAGGYLVAPDGSVSNKENMNIVEFRGLEKGRYTLKVGSYIYTHWPKVYRLLDEKAVDFSGEKDVMVEFDRYVLIKE